MLCYGMQRRLETRRQIDVEVLCAMGEDNCACRDSDDGGAKDDDDRDGGSATASQQIVSLDQVADWAMTLWTAMLLLRGQTRRRNNVDEDAGARFGMSHRLPNISSLNEVHLYLGQTAAAALSNCDGIIEKGLKKRNHYLNVFNQNRWSVYMPTQSSQSFQTAVRCCPAYACPIPLPRPRFRGDRSLLSPPRFPRPALQFPEHRSLWTPRPAIIGDQRVLPPHPWPHPGRGARPRRDTARPSSTPNPCTVCTPSGSSHPS
jgi:hypothetical protein